MPIQPPTYEELGEIYQELDDTVNTLQDAALAIAGPAARAVLCDTGGLLSLNFGRLARLSGPLSLPGLLDKAGGLLQRGCPIPPPLPDLGGTPPFTGGQCEGVAYDIQLNGITYTPDDGSPPSSGGNGLIPLIYGPITYIGDDGSPNITRGRVVGRNRFGSVDQRIVSGQSSPGFWSVANPVIVRRDGSPDDCGDPPPGPPPPRPPIDQPPPSPPIPRVDPDGNPLPPIVFTPKVGPIYVDVDGSLNIPVEVNVNGPDVNVNIPVAVNLGDFSPTLIGPITGGGGGAGGEPGPPIRICCDGPPPRIREGEDEEPDEEPAEEPKPDMAISAVLVSSFAVGDTRSNSTIFTAAPPLLVPRIGTVQFEVEVEGQRYIGPDVQLKQQSQLVEAPTEARVTRAFVRWEPGWSGSFVYLEKARNDPFPSLASE